MNWREYFALEAVNWSSLKHMDDSALAYLHHLTHPDTDTPQKAAGRYVHTAIFEPEKLEDEFAIWTTRRSGKDWKAFAAENAHRTILRAADLEPVQGTIDALRAHEGFQALLALQGHSERVITWTDPTTGIPCKARPDRLSAAARMVLDLKRTPSIDIRRFGHVVTRYAMHGQLAHYSAGITEALGWTPTQHILVAVESSPPHDIGIFPLDEDTMNVGREKVAELLGRVAECRASGRWPGRYEKPVTLGPANLPPWMFGGGIPEIAFVEDSP